MGLLHDSFVRFVPLLYTFVDMCFALTIVSDSGAADVTCDRRNQTGVGIDGLPMYCQNGGSCTPKGCDCIGGFYGTVCQHSVINAVIVVVVCILPPASWTMVFCYGCKERRRKRRLRQLRRQQQNGFASTDNLTPSIFGDDLPPSYSEIAHTNPIALCAMDNQPYQTYIDPPPPDYDDVLKKAIECGAVLPLQATSYSQQMDAICAIDNEGVQQETQIDQMSLSSSSSSSLSSSVNDQEEEATPPIDSVMTIDETVSVAIRYDDVNEDNHSCVQCGVMVSDNPMHSSREELLEESPNGEDIREKTQEQCQHGEASNNATRTVNECSIEHMNSDTIDANTNSTVLAMDAVASEDDVMNTSQEDLIARDSDDDH